VRENVADPKQSTTAPPPFDPEEFARYSETSIPVPPDARRTAPLAPPPLNKRVSLAVPLEDLEWFELSDEAKALLPRIDGTQTLFELMEGSASQEFLRAVAELHDARLLAFAP
jgi:hypothetical protein